MSHSRVPLSDFKDKVAVVTGAGEGIGKGIATKLAEQGAKLVLVGIHHDNIAQLAAKLAQQGAKASAYQVDVADLTQMQHLAEQVLTEHGEVHLLCNNAGVAYPCEFTDIVVEDWQHIFQVNLWGTLNGIKVFLPIMERQGEGHISATASEAGLYSPGASFFAAYNISKHAQVGLMTSLEGDLKSRHSPVTSSIFCPSTTRTKATKIRQSASDYGFSPMSPQAREFWAAVTEALAEQGMAIEDSAQYLIDGITRGDFWIFSHPHVPQTYVKQAELMLGQQALLDIGLNEQ